MTMMMTGKLSPVRKLHSLMSDPIFCFLNTPNDSETPTVCQKVIHPTCTRNSMEEQISSTEKTFIARKNAIKMMIKRYLALRRD